MRREINVMRTERRNLNVMCMFLGGGCRCPLLQERWCLKLQRLCVHSCEHQTEDREGRIVSTAHKKKRHITSPTTRRSP